MYFGYLNKKDIYPNNLSSCEAIKMFVTMYNCQVSDKFAINFDYGKYETLSEIFEIKLQDLINTLHESDKSLQNKIKNFVKIAKDSLIFKADDLFRQYIFSRIKTRNKFGLVKINGDFIEFEVENKLKYAILPVFKVIDNAHEQWFHDESFKLLQNYHKDNIDLYLACPKSKNFTKFIDLSCEHNLKFKLVPYNICNKFLMKGII